MELRMLRSSLLALIALLVTSAASAQEPVPPWELGALASPPTPWAYETPPGYEVDEERPPIHRPLADPSSQPEATRGEVGLEILGGIIGFAFPVGLGVALMSDGNIGTGLLLLGAAPFTVTAGIYLAGSESGGHGSLEWTFLGQALGGLASAPIAVGLLFATFETDEHCGDSDNPCDSMNGTVALTAGLLTSAVLSVGGGVLAYELSDDGDDGPSVSVGITPTTTGATVSLSGRL
jgi:hypothetical protein